MSKLRIVALVSLLVAAGTLRAQTKNLEIYWVDVEGGAAALIVAPSGESLLFDVGNRVAADDRDAKRVFAAAQQAGVKKIDHFVLSHFHGDHAGGLEALAKLIPIEHCYDRGDFIEPPNQQWRDAYLRVCGAKRTIPKPGDKIPLKGVQVDVVANDGQLITKPINGGGPNPLCATAEHKPHDVAENERMLGLLITYGKFTYLDTKDLNWEKEMELACPVNKVGQVTIWETDRHGSLDGAGAPGFMYAAKPQVVIVNNGPRKGFGGNSPGVPKTTDNHYDRIAKIPGLEDIWQLHLNLVDPDPKHNTAPDMIANLDETAACQGHWIKASVARDGKFTLTNGRNAFSKTYTARGTSRRTDSSQ
jgi:beta-lactamase superfamily II metal-dependent hydrolase